MMRILLIISLVCWTVVWAAGGVEETITRQSAACMGCEVNVQPNSEDSKQNQVLRNITMHINDALTGEHKHALVPGRVLSFSTQVVAGALYKVTYELGESSCDRKGYVSGLESDCALTEGGEVYVCQAQLWERVWMTPTYEVRDNNCTAEALTKKVKRSTGAATGVFEEISDASTDELVNFAVEQLQHLTDANYVLKLTQRHHTKAKVVEGRLVHFIVEVGLTTCHINSVERRDNCPLDAEKERRICSVHVWEKPWSKFRQVTNYVCSQSKVDEQKHFLGKLSNISGVEAGGKFKKFVVDHNKKYGTEAEMSYRLGVFTDNLHKIKLLQDTEQANGEYGVTKATDLTDAEFQKYYLGFYPELSLGHNSSHKTPVIPDVKLPTTVDWRTENAVTPVKNQGMCGSCWAFSVTGNIEGQNAVKNKKLVSLSEQELLDCDTSDKGCGGGMMEDTYSQIMLIGGLEGESQYPYEGHMDKCRFNKTLVKVQINGSVDLPKCEHKMACYLTQHGPLSIGLNANGMQFYMGGVSHPFKWLCSAKNIDHGVLIVGYGTHTTKITHRVEPYWIIKNSWGPTWGELGYYRLFRGDGSCGVDQYASSAIPA